MKNHNNYKIYLNRKGHISCAKITVKLLFMIVKIDNYGVPIQKFEINYDFILRNNFSNKINQIFYILKILII